MPHEHSPRRTSQYRYGEERMKAHSTFLISAGLFLLVLICYWDVQNHTFINFDDPRAIIDNPFIKHGITLKSIVWAFTTNYYDYWHPLPWISHMIDYQLFGLNAGGYLLVNLILHGLNAILLFSVLKRMTGSVWKSACVAALFAAHPINVESVAWAVERKNVLSTFFWLLTMLAYSWYVERPALRRYAVVFSVFAIGLAAKPMLVTLPFALLLLDFWPLQRCRFRGSQDAVALDASAGNRTSVSWRMAAIEKIPMVAVSAASILFTIAIIGGKHALYSLHDLPLAARLLNSATAYPAYLWKLFVPRNLAILYPLHPNPNGWLVLGAACLLLAITAGAAVCARRRPYLLIGWLWFTGTLLPLVGLVQSGPQSMADRFSYVPQWGIFIALTWLAADLVGNRRKLRNAVLVLFGAILLLLAVSSIHQVRFWRNSISLYEHTLKVTSLNPLILNNLGTSFDYNERNFDTLFSIYSEVLRIAPRNYQALYNLGYMLEQKGELQKAQEYFERSIASNPTYANPYRELGIVHKKTGSDSAAMNAFVKAYQYDPSDWHNSFALGQALFDKHDLDSAAAMFQRALESCFSPDCWAIHNDLGLTLLQNNDPKHAVSHFLEAIRLDSTSWLPYSNLGTALLRMGKLHDATTAFSCAINRAPPNEILYVNRAGIYALCGRLDSACADYQKAVSLQPTDENAQVLLAKVFSLRGDLDSAAVHLEKAEALDKADGRIRELSAEIHKKSSPKN